ncbi:MAG: hypothetical protein EB127_06375 [Alphaproteobacteria bacterium]|nr:hypothetical protein [Alphaproteobacteria bacterium]
MKKPITLVELDGAKRLSSEQDFSSHLSTHAFLYLQPNGWFNDYPCDEEGITPWYTFPAIAFLKDIIKPEYKVLEFGSGFSTLYFKDKVSSLITVEHSQEWADKLLAQNPSLDIHVVKENAGIHPVAEPYFNSFLENFIQIKTTDHEHDLMHGLICNSFGGYASMIFQSQPKFYDIVVIDGMARALCAYLTVESGNLKDDGIIILDNSDRWHYNTIQTYLNSKGFGRIDFWGPGWNNYNAWCTSFYSKKFPINNNRITRIETTGQILV